MDLCSNVRGVPTRNKMFIFKKVEFVITVIGCILSQWCNQFSLLMVILQI